MKKIFYTTVFIFFVGVLLSSCTKQCKTEYLYQYPQMYLRILKKSDSTSVIFDTDKFINYSLCFSYFYKPLNKLVDNVYPRAEKDVRSQIKTDSILVISLSENINRLYMQIPNTTLDSLDIEYDFGLSANGKYSYIKELKFNNGIIKRDPNFMYTIYR